MNIDLKELSKRENERVEWKENVADVDDIVKTAVAFANDFSNLGGGYIVCGAKEIKDEYGFPKMLTVGLTASRLKEIEGKATPFWRNQALAYFFNKLQLAQAEGQGIPTIIRTMHEEECPAPVFETDSESLTCILQAHKGISGERIYY